MIMPRITTPAILHTCDSMRSEACCQRRRPRALLGRASIRYRKIRYQTFSLKPRRGRNKSLAPDAPTAITVPAAALPTRERPRRAAALASSATKPVTGRARIRRTLPGLRSVHVAAPPDGARRDPTGGVARAERAGATSGSARRPCWPAPCGRCRPCACTRRPAGTARRSARWRGAGPSSSRGAGGRTRRASARRACGRAARATSTGTW